MREVRRAPVLRQEAHARLRGVAAAPDQGRRTPVSARDPRRINHKEIDPMHGRFRFLFSPDGVAPGPPAAPSTPAPAPTPGPDVAALVAAAVKAEVGPLLEQLHAARGETAAEKTARAKAEADTVAAAAAKGTADEQIKSLTARFNDANTRAALSSSADRYTYTSPVAKEQALIAFRATHPAEVNAANEVVAKVAGKDVPLGS